jgi:hypothetical protein
MFSSPTKMNSIKKALCVTLPVQLPGRGVRAQRNEIEFERERERERESKRNARKRERRLRRVVQSGVGRNDDTPTTNAVISALCVEKRLSFRLPLL